MRRLRRRQLSLIVAALAFAATACGKSAAARKPPSTPVRVAPATRIDVPAEAKAKASMDHNAGTVIKRGERMLELRNVVKHFPLPRVELRRH